MPASVADEILAEVFRDLGLTTDEERYAGIYEVIDALRILNAAKTISSGTTGTISERLAEMGLRLSAEGSFVRTTAKAWSWAGDFALFGVPFNTLISVKSFKAKERLLVSGSGSQLAPTIGWGLFDDAKEFHHVDRLRAYKLRGFTSIYMPRLLHGVLPAECQNFKNINEKPFLRLIEHFPRDIDDVLEHHPDTGAAHRIVNAFKL